MVELKEDKISQYTAKVEKTNRRIGLINKEETKPLAEQRNSPEDDCTDSGSQIVMDSDNCDGEYLVYTAKRLQVCISRNHERNSNECGNKPRKADLKLETALLGNSSVVWSPEAEFSITEPCLSPDSIPRSDMEDDNFSDCSACNGFGKRPSRRKKQQFRRRWCPQCKVHPGNIDANVPGGIIREITSISNETLDCQLNIRPPPQEPQDTVLSILGHSIYPENSYYVYVPDLLSEITVKGKYLMPDEKTDPSNPSTFIILIEGNQHQGTKLRPVTEDNCKKELLKVEGVNPTITVDCLKCSTDSPVFPGCKIVSSPNKNTEDLLHLINPPADHPNRNLPPTGPEQTTTPHHSPVHNNVCPAPKEIKCHNCHSYLISGGCYNCASIYKALRDPPPTLYLGVEILPNNQYLVHIPDLGTDLSVTGLDLRSNPNDVDPGNPNTILVLTEDKVFVGSTITKPPVNCLGVPVDPSELYDVFVPEFGTTVRVRGCDIFPGEDGSTVCVRFKDKLLSATSITPRDKVTEPKKRLSKKHGKPNTPGKMFPNTPGNMFPNTPGNMFPNTPGNMFPNKISEQLFGNLGLPLLASSTSLSLDGQTPYPFGDILDEEEPSTMELDHLPSCVENNAGTIIPPLLDNNRLNHCPNCSCFNHTDPTPEECDNVQDHVTCPGDSNTKRLVTRGHLHCQECIAPVPGEQPKDHPELANCDPMTSSNPLIRSSAVRWGGDIGGFSISTLYGSVPVESNPVDEPAERRNVGGKRRTSPPPCKPGDKTVTLVCNPGDEVTEEPGLRDLSGLPLPDLDREIILTCGHVHNPGCYFVRRV